MESVFRNFDCIRGAIADASSYVFGQICTSKAVKGLKTVVKFWVGVGLFRNIIRFRLRNLDE